MTILYEEGDGIKRRREMRRDITEVLEQTTVEIDFGE